MLDNCITCIFIDKLQGLRFFSIIINLYIIIIIIHSYAGMLKTQKPNLVSEQDFHKKSDVDAKQPITTSKVSTFCH